MADYVQLQKAGSNATVSLDGQTTYLLPINRTLDDDQGAIWLGLVNDAAEEITFGYLDDHGPTLVARVDSQDDLEYVKDQIRAIGKAVGDAGRRFETMSNKRAAREQLAAGLIGQWTRQYGSEPATE